MQRCLHHKPRHRHATKASALLNESALRRRQRHKQPRPLNPPHRPPRPASRPRMRHRFTTHLTRPSSHVLQASAAILRTTLSVCHATPYASRQKLNTDIGIIQLATRISVRGIQCRPRMTTQGHNLDVRTRQLSHDFSFRADHDSGSSGLSTPTSSRSLDPIVHTRWRWLRLHIRICDRHRRMGKGRCLGIKRSASVLPSFWFGWGGVVPPMEGARLPLHAAYPFRLRQLPFALA